MQLRRLVSAMDLSSVSVRGVTGWEGRTNDVVTLRDRDPALMERVIVFCGGDVQDLEERMLRHRDNSRYSQWSLERTAMLLANVTIIIICTMTRLTLCQAFPRSYIAVVKPARMERATFSCYDNFVPSNSVGCPEHCDNAGAVPHLRLLLRGLQGSTRGLQISMEIGHFLGSRP